MNGKTVLTLLLLAFSLTMYAQKGTFSLSAGPTYGLPLNRNLKNFYHNGMGGSIGILFNTTSNSSALVKLNRLYIKPQKAGEATLHLTAVNVGYKIYFNQSNFFVTGHAGLYTYSGNSINSSSSVGLGAGLGYTLPVGSRSHIDIAPSMDWFRSGLNSRWVNIHLGYRINLNGK